MHFHVRAFCMCCQAYTTFSTPIPNILLLSDMCPHCGWNDLVGRDDKFICAQCRDMWREDLMREHNRIARLG